MLYDKIINQSATPPDGAPPVAFNFEQARLEWFERYGSAIVEKNRYFIIAAFAALTIVSLIGLLFFLLPLKTVVPYVIKIEPNGRVIADNASVQEYTPSMPELQYFLSQWSIKMLTIDPAFTEKHYLPDAFSQVVSIAIGQFQDWVKIEQPISRLQQDPSLSRTVHIISAAQVQDNVMIIRAKTEERSLNTPAQLSFFQITIHYVRNPPQTPEAIQRNPIGIFITRFNITKELS